MTEFNHQSSTRNL